MAEPSQYIFSLQELIEMIIRKQGIHEGHWSTNVGVQIGSGNFGPSQDQLFPGACVTFANFGIQRIDPSAPHQPGAIIVDAAKVNPRPKAKKASAASAS